MGSCGATLFQKRHFAAEIIVTCVRVTGSDLYDAIALKRINDQTTKATLKKSGKVVSNARRMISKDGKVMTLTITGTNPKGEKMHNVAVYDKQ